MGGRGAGGQGGRGAWVQLQLKPEFVSILSSAFSFIVTDLERLLLGKIREIIVFSDWFGCVLVIAFNDKVWWCCRNLAHSFFETLTTQTSPLPTQPKGRKEKNKQTNKEKKTSSPSRLSLVKHKVNVPPAWK